MSNSQNDEEAVILRYAGAEPKEVLDIGAYDGKTYSNSFALIERGWSAILVEPSPSAFLKLMKLHGENKNVKLLNAMVGIETRIAKFYDCEGDLCSSSLEKNRDLWAGAGRKFTEYYVPQITLQTMTNQLGGGPTVVSIDCEGTSVDILMSMPTGWAPRVVVVEHDSRIIEIVGWMRDRGLQLAEGGINGENAIFVRK